MNEFSTGIPRVGIFIVPGDVDKGMLEDLCLRTVADHPAMPCVDGFLECLRGKVEWREPEDVQAAGPHRFPNNAAKAKAKAFLAAQKDDLPSVGVAALAGIWNFDADCLEQLRGFIKVFGGP
jgi:hypothetical protein